MARLLKRIAPLSLFLAAACLYAAEPVIQSARYVPDENKLVLNFDQDVDAGSVLLGQLSFDDDDGGPNANLAISGGAVLTPADLSSTIEIDLLFSTLIDSFVGKYYDENEYVFRLWGAKPDQVMTLENMDADNLVLMAGDGAFVNGSYESSATQSVACTVDTVTVEPKILSATYDANINKIQFVFSNTVQFDQIAEDRSVAGGPGDGLLQSPVGTNDPGEDRNGNGVLDFEQNIKFLRIGFTGTGGAMTLENIGRVVQTADSDIIDMYLTNNDAKRLEGTLGLDANLKLDIQPWAFVDQNYNPNAVSELNVTSISDSVTFIPDSASYNLSKNELSIFFNNLAAAGRSIKITKPAPVYTKIVLSNGSESHTISGVEGNPSIISGSGNTAFKFKLQIVDQASVEALINGNDMTLSMESYALYDNLGNGNADVTGVPVEVVETASANEQPPQLKAAAYDEDTRTLTLTWDLSLGVGYYLGATLPGKPTDWEDLASQNLTGFGAYDPAADSSITFGSGKVYYSGSKKNTFVRLDQSDAIRIQSYPNPDSLRMTVDRDVFNAFLFLNGNAATTAGDSVMLNVVPDITAPVITNAKMNVFTHAMEFKVDEPVEAVSIDPGDFTLGGVSLSGSVAAVSGAEYDNQFILSLDDATYNAFMALPDSVLIAPDLISAKGSMTNLARLGSPADTMNAPAGRYFYLLSREAFATEPVTHFGALKLISDHCEIYVAEDVWGTRITMDDVLKLASTFEDSIPTDTSRGIKAIVDDWYGEVKDTDGNGKVIIFLDDILDEYDLGRNDTNDSFFENGYVTMADTTDGANSNHGDIIYLDVDPQVVGTPPYTDWNHTMLHALAYQYAHMAALHNKPDQETWIRYGVALKLEEMVVGNVKFFGEGAISKATAANELTYINASLLKSRDDLYNVYNFFTYLTEKYSDPDEPLAVIKAIAASDEMGIAAVDEAIALFNENTTTAEAFSNYGTACFLDLVQDSTGAGDDIDSLYNGIYSFDALALNAPPSGKNAGNIPWDKAANNGAPFPKSGIFPWSFNFYVSRAYFLNLEGQVVIVSPDLQPEDTLIFDGYDGIQYKAKKIMLRSDFMSPMTQDFEVVDFELDDANSRGSLPVSTDSRFHFRDTYPDTITGSQLMALVVSKTDYAQPPVTYDFVLTNITSKPEFGDFYTLQNPDADTYLDLFIVSQRALYDLTGTEGAKVQVNGEFDTTVVTMEKLHDFGSQASVYSGKYELTTEGSYELLFTGQDQNGIALDPVTRSISVGLAKPASATSMILPDDLGQIDIPSHAVENERWLVGGSFKMTGGMSFMQLPRFPGTVHPVSDVVYTANTPFKLNRTATLSLSLTDEQLNSPTPLGVYLLVDGNWEYIGGKVDRSSQTIAVNTNYLGRYVVAAGEHGQVYQGSIIPETYVLEQNYPNPFNPSTTISFGLPEDGVVSLKVYDIRGREVVTLAQSHFTAGTYQVTWHALDARHNPVASGVYFYVLNSESFRQVKKMVLTK